MTRWLLVIGFMLMGCKKIEGAVPEAARVLGGNAVCTTVPTSSHRAHCIKDGAFFACMSDGKKWVCAAMSAPTAEQPK